MIPQLNVSELGVFGGKPEFTESIHVGRPNIGDTEKILERMSLILQSKWLTNGGPWVQKFEKLVAEYIGVRHCIAMCNGTVALEIAIRACGLKGEVIIPSFTFIATAHALKWQEITPVFCDVAPGSHNIDPEKVESLITPNTTGIIGVHVWGIPCDISGLSEIAERRNLTLLFDCAHGFTNSYGNGKLGSFGKAEILSFHSTKFFNTFEGGAVVTNDDDLAKRIRLMKNFGFQNMDNVDYIGTNGKMTEVAAMFGVSNFESIEKFSQHNQKNYARYNKNLSQVPGVKIMQYKKEECFNYQYVVLELNPQTFPFSRDETISFLHGENILARRYFYPGCHKMEPYRSHFPHAGLLLPETERMAERIIVLPNGTSVGIDDIDRVCSLIKYLSNNFLEIRRDGIFPLLLPRSQPIHV